MLAADPLRANRTWQIARRQDDPWIARLPLFELTYREFLRAQEQPAPAAEFAELGFELFDRLPKAASREFWALIANAEMRGMAEHDADAFVRSLDKLALLIDTESGDQNLLAWLFGVRLRYLTRVDSVRLLSALDEVTRPFDDAMAATLMNQLLNCDQDDWCLPAMERLAELFFDRPNQRLFVVLQYIRLLSEHGREIEAYEQASALVAEHTDSGDAWQAYAAASQAVGRSGDADHAYSRIVASVPIGSQTWQEALLAQLKGRLASGATNAACALRKRALDHDKTHQAAKSIITASAVRCDTASL